MERAASTVCAPATARPCAMARPIPRLAPATRAVWPVRAKTSFTVLGYQSWNHPASVDDVRWTADGRLIRFGWIDAQDRVDGVEEILGLNGEVGDLSGL